MAPPVITVTRQYGSGGSDIARLVAERLGWELVDNEFVEEVAGGRLGRGPGAGGAGGGGGGRQGRPVREAVLGPPPPRRDQLRSGRERGAARVRGRGGAGGRRGEETGMEMSAEWGVRSAE